MLNRVRDFLPQLEAANKDIEKKLAEDPQSVDIENINEDEETYIEMVNTSSVNIIVAKFSLQDLGLGVFKQKREDGTISEDEESEDTEEENSSSTDTNGDESTESLEEQDAPFEERKIRPLPRRKGEKSQMIVELN